MIPRMPPPPGDALAVRPGSVSCFFCELVGSGLGPWALRQQKSLETRLENEVRQKTKLEAKLSTARHKASALRRAISAEKKKKEGKLVKKLSKEQKRCGACLYYAGDAAGGVAAIAVGVAGAGSGGGEGHPKRPLQPVSNASVQAKLRYFSSRLAHWIFTVAAT